MAVSHNSPLRSIKIKAMTLCISMWVCAYVFIQREKGKDIKTQALGVN